MCAAGNRVDAAFSCLTILCVVIMYVSVKTNGATHMTEQEQIAAFIARKGVTKVAEGEAALGHWSRQDWRSAARGERTTDDLIRERHVVVINGREYVSNGLGERIA